MAVSPLSPYASRPVVFVLKKLKHEERHPRVLVLNFRLRQPNKELLSPPPADEALKPDGCSRDTRSGEPIGPALHHKRETNQ